MGEWTAEWVTTHAMFVIAISVAVMAVAAGSALTHKDDKAKAAS